MRNPIMVGDRVYLRPREPEDAEPMAWMEAVEEDTFMWRQALPSGPITYNHWIRGAYRDRPPSSIALAVCRRQDDRFIGTVGVIDVDWVHRNGETFSELGPAEVRGQGLGTEAKHLLLEYCFERLHLHVLRSEVQTTNTRSAAALAKQGYRQAGLRKWIDVKDGRYVDQVVFDLTREDWRAARP